MSSLAINTFQIIYCLALFIWKLGIIRQTQYKHEMKFFILYARDDKILS